MDPAAGTPSNKPSPWSKFKGCLGYQPKAPNQCWEIVSKESSIIGCNRAVGTDSSDRYERRLLWRFCLIILFVIFLCFSIFHIKKYYDRETRISINNFDIDENRAPFPWVTICSLRRVDFYAAHKLTQLMKSLEIELTNHNYHERVDGHDIDIQSDEFIKSYRGLYNNITDSIYNGVHTNGSGGVYVNYKSDELKQRMLSSEIFLASIDPNILEKNSASWEEFMVSCKYDNKECKKKYFMVEQKTPYYYCYTYNQSVLTNRHYCYTENKNKQMLTNPSKPLRDGHKNGWSAVVLAGSGILRWKYGNNYSIPGIFEDLVSSEGVRVVIHAPNTTANPTSDGYDVPPGFSVSLGVRLGIQERLGLPYGNCSARDQAGSADHAQDQKSSVRCHNCLQTWIGQNCSCSDSTLLTYLHPFHDCNAGTKSMHKTCPYCQNFSDAMARGLKLTEFMKQHIQCKDILKEEFSKENNLMRLKCKCYPLCCEYTYDISYSLSKWPPTGYESASVWKEIFTKRKFLNHFNTSTEKYKMYYRYTQESPGAALSDFASVNVFVEDRNVVVMSEVAAMDILDLFGAIGGHFGGWIGLSVVVVIQSIELSIIGCYKLNKENQKNRAKPASPDQETRALSSDVELAIQSPSDGQQAQTSGAPTSSADTSSSASQTPVTSAEVHHPPTTSIP